MSGIDQEAEEDRVRPFVDGGSTKSDFDSVAVSDLDWFGNTTLHHCFGNAEIVMPSVRKVLEKFPEYAFVRNQFGRIPLHYALDRLKVNVAAVKSLIEIYPEGVKERDNESKTPYDIAVKWKHSREIKKLLLDVDPDLDRAMHFRIRFGVLAMMYNFIFRVERRAKRRRVYTNCLPPAVLDVTVQDDGNNAFDEPSSDSGFGINHVSSLSSVMQLSELPYSGTARGDISEQYSYLGTSRLTGMSNRGNESARRGSLQELAEETS